MHVALVPHPDTPSNRPIAVAASAVRNAKALLSVEYRVTGAIDALLIPPPAPPTRADELWRHTCFEVFVRTSGSSYLEFNFSPSGEWAAYRFSDFRRGMRIADDVDFASPVVQRNDDGLQLCATVDLSGIGDLSGNAPWRLGLSAVIEEKDGAISFWALAHPPGRPDFHHEDCFALELPPPSEEDGA